MNRREYSKEYTRINRKLESKWFPKVHKAIKSKVSSLIGVVESRGIDAGVRHLNEDIANIRLSKVVEDLYVDVGMIHARLDERRLRKTISKGYGKSDSWKQFIIEFLESFLLEKITYTVNETTREQLLSVMQEAIEEGLGVTETISRLEDLPFTRYQAARIVRTEVNRAANTGSYAQGEFFEYELNKEWISTRDVRTRGNDPEDHADHLRMDGQVVDFYGMFMDPRNGHLLRFPGDPEAEAGDTVFCRCKMVTIPKEDENGRLIPKKTRVTVLRPEDIRRPRIVTI